MPLRAKLSNPIEIASLSTTVGPNRASAPAEPVVAVILPEPTRIYIRHFDCDDVLRILEPQLRGNAQLYWEAIHRGQRFIAKRQRQQRLRMKRARHVDRAAIVVSTAERHIACAHVGTDTRQEVAEGHATPFANGTPAFD